MNISKAPALHALIANDAYAMTFQSLPQYRTALLNSLIANQAAPTVPVAWRDALRWSGAEDYHGRIAFLPAQLDHFVSMLTAHQPAQEQAEPVDGDMLPPVGAKVLIHLGRQDAWVEHTVIGYYVWPACKHQVKDGEKDAHRVFVRVKDAQGYDNARLLSEVKVIGQAAHQEPVAAPQQAAAPDAVHITPQEAAAAGIECGDTECGGCTAGEPWCIHSAPGTPEAPKKPAHGHRDDYYLLANGRRLGLEPISRVRNMPNWVLAMELFATGSGSAYQICRDAGVDPEGTTIQRAAQLDGGQEGSAT